MPETATPLLVLKILFDALTGLPPKGDRFALQRDLREILSEEARVILLDEAQALTKNSIEEVRRLHDHRTTRFGLVLCGGNGTKETLARFKMLGSRTKRWVEFDEMSFEEVLQVIPRYHPLFEKTAPEVLKEIYDRIAKGMWRNWASFHAIESAREHGADTVGERIMRDVCERRKGGRDGSA